MDIFKEKLTNSQKVSFELFHHGFEIFVIQGFLAFKPSRSKHAIYQSMNIVFGQSFGFGNIDQGVEELG